MNMSLYELYVWLTGLDFPSLFSIWTWLITVPWWLAILTVIFIVFTVRIAWSMTFYFLNWLFDWTFRAGVRFGEWIQIIRGYMATALEFGRWMKKRILR
jgi:hypothetical protein